ncbi:hypothetical protein MKK70_18585 [Methylobacterium sp. E-041]|uniref:hypothetical protein n=1 Tax=Methylobacterium sp. E-041 TaxID=2836573 RepID=UPI001FBAA593|nr:hypothetical protein [Methylobacterium sp. E-041]MCJ2107354.1 hypothetical protein [Methylobacterium sp. E-041]
MYKLLNQHEAMMNVISPKPPGIFLLKLNLIITFSLLIFIMQHSLRTARANDPNEALNDSIDYSQQWLTTVNNPTMQVPHNSLDKPSYGRLLPRAKNIASIDFRPTGNINNRAMLDAIAFYNSISGNLSQSIGSPMDDPSSGSSNCRARRYPAGHRYDLHTFTVEGLKLGVVGKNNGKVYTAGNCYAGGFRLEPEWKPGMSLEIVFKNGNSPFIWMPLWSFSGTQLSPNRIPEAKGNPYYTAANGAKLFNNTLLSSNNKNDHFQYYEQDFGDFWTSNIYGPGKGLTGGLVAYQSGPYDSPAFKLKPYTQFLATSNGFYSNQETKDPSGYRYTSLSEGMLSDRFYTLMIDWPNDGSNIIRYILDGKVYQEQYQEFLTDSYTDIHNTVKRQAMHLLFGMQGVPSFAFNVRNASSLITNRDELSMTLQSVKIWEGNLDPESLIYPANAFPELLIPKLSSQTAYLNEPFSFTISNQSVIKEGSTVYKADSYDGSKISVDSLHLGGVFTSLGPHKISITEIPQPTSKTGLTVAYGGRPKTTYFVINVIRR